MTDRVKNEPALSTADFVAGGERRRQDDSKAADFPGATGGAQMAREQEPAALFNDDESRDLRARWNDIQTGFVDEPRAAVAQADELVAATMKRLAEIFAAERSKLEQQWDRGDNMSTEDLRLALQRYRSFFNRLLSL
jgi:hypothetical protein